MQVDPIEPTLKAPGTRRLRLNYDVLLSSFALKFNLRRYSLRATLHGEAVQVDPRKPKMKPPGTKRLKLRLRYSAFNFCFQIQLAPLQHEIEVGITSNLEAGWCGFTPN